MHDIINNYRSLALIRKYKYFFNLFQEYNTGIGLVKMHAVKW